MRRSKPVRLETAPTRGKSVYLFLEFTINEIVLNIGSNLLHSQIIVNPLCSLWIDKSTTPPQIGLEYGYPSRAVRDSS